MADDFTLRFGLDVADRRNARASLSPQAREQDFAREQIRILLRYVTLHQNGRRLDPDGFAIVTSPDDVIDLDPEAGA